MTHGDIYIPYTTPDGKEKYLYCEAWSDGYFDGVGYAMLSSSNHMEDIIKLNTIFLGSPFYYDPQTQKLEAKEADRLEHLTNNTRFNKSFIEAFQLFKEQNLEALYQSKFAKISIEKKIKADITLNAQVMDFTEVLNGGKIISDIHESIQYVKKVAKYDGETLSNYEISSTSYIYYDNQWYVGIYNNNDKYNYIPLIIGVLNFTDYNTNANVTRSGCLADPFTYIEQGPSEKDLKTLKELYQFNIENNFDMEKRTWQYIKEYVEKVVLEDKIVDVKSSKVKLKI